MYLIVFMGFSSHHYSQLIPGKFFCDVNFASDVFQPLAFIFKNIQISNSDGSSPQNSGGANTYHAEYSKLSL